MPAEWFQHTAKPGASTTREEQILQEFRDREAENIDITLNLVGVDAVSSLEPLERLCLQLSTRVPELALAERHRPSLDPSANVSGVALWTLPNYAALCGMAVDRRHGTVDIIDVGVYRVS